MKRIVLTLCVFFALLTAAIAGEVYNCIDRDGNTVLTTSPQDGMTKCESRGGDGLTSKTGQSSCEIVKFSQYDVASGGGSIVGGYVSHGWLTGASVVGNETTCVDLTIRNNDSVKRTIINTGIVAVTEKGNKRSPKGFMTTIKPNGVYKGPVCFDDNLSSITKLECKFE